MTNPKFNFILIKKSFSHLYILMRAMQTTLSRYLSLVKFSHTVFALPFALTGLTFGFRDVGTAGSLGYYAQKLIFVLLCMVTARSAAMGFNRWADRHIDAANARTAIREIPAGLVGANAALWFVVVNCIVFVVSTAFINRLCLYLSPVALAVVLGYSYTKRFTPLCHLVLGAGLALAPVGAYIAVTEQFHLGIVVLGLGVLCWTAGFDIIYALQDEGFDRAQGLRSLPAWLGGARALGISRSLHLLSLAALLAAGYLLGVGLLYAVGCSLFGFFLVYQHSLVKATDLSRVNLAFFTANGFASVAFGVLAIADVLLR